MSPPKRKAVSLTPSFAHNFGRPNDFLTHTFLFRHSGRQACFQLQESETAAIIDV